MKEVNVTIEVLLNCCTLTIEDHVPRHSQRIDPPEWEVREYDTEEEARSWLKEHDGTSFSVVKLRVSTITPRNHKPESK